jgi:hypothetical protein
MAAEFLFSDEFIKHLAKELDCSPKNIRRAISTYDSSEQATVVPKKTKVKKTGKQVTIKKKDDNEKHLCERVKRGKTEPCGKNAQNRLMVNGKEQWYCGPKSGNSGCFSVMLKQQANNNLSKQNDEDKEQKTTYKSLTGLKKNKKDSVTKSKDLLTKTIHTHDYKPRKVKTKGGETVYADPTTNIVFDRETKEAYGKYKNKKVIPLESEDIRRLESDGQKIRREDKDSESSDSEGSSSSEGDENKSSSNEASVSNSESDDSSESSVSLSE